MIRVVEMQMKPTWKHAGLMTAVVAAMGAAACSNQNSQPTMDDGLKRDLSAVTAKPAQVVVSPLEAGMAATPAPVPHSPARKPTRRTVAHVATNRTSTRAPAPTRRSVERIPAPTTRSAPAAQGPDAAGRAEAEIFRNMPWIRP
jgi:cobalamin biosynthesis Mg chelatase CobN